MSRLVGCQATPDLNLRDGALIMEDNIIHLPIGSDVVGSLAGDVPRDTFDSKSGIRQCARHSGSLDSGLSRHIATFLYRDVVTSDHDYRTEKRTLKFLSPVGARVYQSTSDVVH